MVSPSRVSNAAVENGITLRAQPVARHCAALAHREPVVVPNMRDNHEVTVALPEVSQDVIRDSLRGGPELLRSRKNLGGSGNAVSVVEERVNGFPLAFPSCLAVSKLARRKERELRLLRDNG